MKRSPRLLEGRPAGGDVWAPISLGEYGEIEAKKKINCRSEANRKEAHND